MQALVFERFGGPEVLHLTEVEDPLVAPDEVLVRIHAAGLNFADIYRRRGNYHLSGASPWILGYEGAGEVVRVGKQVRDVGIGDRVAFADCARANAELVSVSLDKVIKLPDGIAYAEAAAVLLQGLTAQYLIADSYALRKGDLAVVHAAGGGVGLLLCQMAAAQGAKVIGLASSEAKRKAAQETGAAWTFSYDGWAEEIRSTVGEPDVIFDSVGTTLAEGLQLLRIGGTAVFFGMAGGDPAPVPPRLLMDRSLTLTGGDLWNVLVNRDTRQRRADSLFEKMLDGKLRVRIAATFPLSEGAQAHRMLENRQTIGKIVLTP